MSQHSRGVDVDLNGLLAFVNQLEAGTELELKPGVARARNEIQHEPRIGRAVPGGQVIAAKQMLIYAMVRVTENSARHIEAAEILSAAIKKALENYAESDRDIASRLAKIEDGLLEAIAAAQPRPTAPSTGPQP